MSLPPVRIEENVKLVGHHLLDGATNTGEGLAMKVTEDGRRLFYVANEAPPVAMSILDVTDPANPELLWQLDCEHDQVRGNSLCIVGDIMLLAKQVVEPGMTPAGFHIFDISTPDAPKELGFFDTSGPHSRGTHFVSTMDGKYAHISTGYSDWQSKDPRDDQFYMIVDIQDPANPKEVGRWWLPGTRVGDPEEVERHEEHDFAFRVHHTLSYPERPDRAYLGYIDGGMIILDISDKANPKPISRLDYHPPMTGFTHTVVPLFDRNLAIIADEATGDHGFDWPKRYWIADISNEERPFIISTFPVPDNFEQLHEEGGRIGAHNIHENEPGEGYAKLVNTCVGTWFSGGLRFYDIRDPFTPKEIGAFLPETPPGGQRACRISDVFVDDRGVIYACDRAGGGIYFLEWTGDQPLD